VKLHSSLAAAAAVLAGLALTSCQSKEPEKADPVKGGQAEITINASDTMCELSGKEAVTGPSTFVITNNGTKVTEFYVYGGGERVMGEVENISPGLQRKLVVQLAEPGTYQTACKPGMVGDGIRGDFKVTGEAVKVDDQGKFKEASDSYKRYLSSQTDALIAATQVFVDAVKRGASTPPRLNSRLRGPTTSASNPWPSRSPTISIPASTSVRRTSSRVRSGPASTDWRRTCGSPGCSLIATRWPTS
jgi:iron uptake system component EfeO